MKIKFTETNRLLFIALAVILSVSLSQAQPGGQKGGQQGPPPLPNDEQIEKMVTDLSNKLNLNETQENQVSDFYFAHFEEVKTIVGDGNSRPDREVMEKMREDFKTEVKSVLTNDQQKEFDAYMIKKESQRGGEGRTRQ